MNLLNQSLKAIDPEARQFHEAERIFEEERGKIYRRTDRLIASLMCLQWPGVILAALTISAKTWNGSASSLHPHVLLAIYLGGLITVVPVLLAFLRPGEVYTRHVVAVCQMMMSGLLIHVTGGRIETHFHVFGSLAFLGFYLDWPVLITATAVTVINHVAMQYYSPASFFGTALVSHWRLVEHICWVLFFDGFLITSCVQNLRVLRRGASKEANQEHLLHQAYHDSLTGLGNRLLIQKTMADMLSDPKQKGQRFALMSLDLDRFKEVNDTLGHQVGDEVLVQVAERMREHIRKNDTLVRMSGDEFAVVVDDCLDSRMAEEIARRIIDTMRRPIFVGGHVIKVGVSIGICVHEKTGLASADLFNHSDLALYKAKNNGRMGLAVFDEKMRSETIRAMSLEHRLRQAVTDKTLQLYYQPIVDTDAGLLGFEALLRWTDEVHGFVSPAEFIPLAEKAGLIIPLGKWVLKQACTQAAMWHKMGRRLSKMSVNVSSLQLADSEFIATVLSALKDSGLPPSLLDLELTESTLIKNHGQTFKTLEFLRKFGVKLSIDDFGTGYSSLSYLRELPVHTLKIDRAFMQDIVTSAEARLLVEGMVEMAHSLHLKVVAEGVETQAQMEILATAGCDEIQGFLISKAVTAEDANRLMYMRDDVKMNAALADAVEDRRFVQAMAG